MAERLSDMVRDAIRKSGLTMNAVTRRGGLHYSAIHRLMNDVHKEPSTKTVDAILKALDLEVRIVKKKGVRRGSNKTR